MTHLVKGQIDAYWGGRLAPAELLSLDRHIGECQACRDELLAAAPAASALARLESDEPEPAGAHLDYERLEQYVDGNTSPGVRAAVEDHIAKCSSCRAELEDLRQFREEYRVRASAARPGKPRLFLVRRRRLVVAAAALAATASFVAVMIGHRESLPGPQPPRASLEVYEMLLSDGGMPLGVNRQGRLRGIANLSESENADLVAILRGGDLPLAQPRPELHTSAGVLRSADAAAPEFSLTSPLGRVVLEDRPVFQWTALPRASAYRVAVFDQDFKPVAESPSLTETQWQTERPLPRGRVYSWQVTAVRGGAEIHAPQPPVPEARFAVLDQPQADRLNAALVRRPASHLALSLLYAQAGMPRECLQELHLLEVENPGSPLLARLRNQVEGKSSGR